LSTARSVASKGRLFLGPPKNFFMLHFMPLKPYQSQADEQISRHFLPALAPANQNPKSFLSLLSHCDLCHSFDSLHVTNCQMARL